MVLSMWSKIKLYFSTPLDSFIVFLIRELFIESSEAFQFVLNLVPIGRKTIGVNLKEMLRVATNAGFCILGMTNDIWQRDNMMDQIKVLNNDQCLFLSLQKIKCPSHDDPSVEIEYVLTVLRKGNELRAKFL